MIAVFPGIVIKGYNFHLYQCVWRQIQEMPDILERYTNDADFSAQLRMLPSLSFRPANDVVDKFEELLDFDFFTTNQVLLQPLLDFFEYTWIGAPRAGGNGRQQPMFPHDMWCTYDLILEGLPKTNNSAEGFHLAFSSLMMCSHPTIWKFLGVLRSQNTLMLLDLQQALAGNPPIPGRCVYRDLAARIKLVAEEYDQSTLLQYLSGMAYNADFGV